MAIVDSKDMAALRALDEARKLCPLIAEKADKDQKHNKGNQKLTHEK
jgi:hypothetical protein